VQERARFSKLEFAQILAPAELVSVEPMPLHYWDLGHQPYMEGVGQETRWNRRVVRRHAHHRDELGGGGRQKNVQSSNYFPTKRPPPLPLTSPLLHPETKTK
jgi:hypothetical protein